MYILAILSFFILTFCKPKPPIEQTGQKIENFVTQSGVLQKQSLRVGAEQTAEYFPDLVNKRVGLVVNHTSNIGKTHLVDTLLKSGIKVVKIFAPEHGFRGDAANGEQVKTSVDAKTGLPLISLYGSKKKPSAEQLADLDVLIFDMQDVGARFFTYISTMHYLMEGCAENNKKLIILDRPNPHGYYVDGPIMEKEHTSFVGVHQIPAIHGLTVGELAQMINGEKWLANGVQCEIKVVKSADYDHKSRYQLPLGPSPNLPNNQAIKLYPSLCLFEATNVSIGRGTDFPFQVYGSTDPALGNFKFSPKTIKGVALNPPLEGKECYGVDLRDVKDEPGFSLRYVLEAYKKTTDKENFFIKNNFFEKLAGTASLRKQIMEGMDEKSIKATWKPGLDQYKAMRKKYLLYPDFE